MYRQAFNIYASGGIEGWGVLTHEFLPEDDFHTTSYATRFATKAADLISNMSNFNLRRIMVWNEPNFGGPDLTESEFARLLYETFQKINDLQSVFGIPATMYMGGLIWKIGFLPTPQDATADLITFLRNTYLAAKDLGSTVPWDAVNVHIHHSHTNFTIDDLAYLRSQVDAVFETTDRRPVVVGEWGLTNSEFIGNDLAITYDDIRTHFDEMWYFSHCNDPSSFNNCENPADFGLVKWNQAQFFTMTGHCNTRWNDVHAAFSRT